MATPGVTTFRRITNYSEAQALSEAGLLWFRWSEDNDWSPDEEGYWSDWADDIMWGEEYEAGIQYGILLED